MRAGPHTFGPLVDTRPDPVEVSLAAQLRAGSAYLVAGHPCADELDDLVEAEWPIGLRVDAEHQRGDAVSTSRLP
ncbi:MAG: hypothetical protein ACRCYU_10315, partial [Nocardioides sp.]